MKTTSKLTLLTSTSLFSLSAFVFASDPSTPSVSPDVALAKLKSGNARFAANEVSTGKPSAARREETAQGQHPFAIVVACADSRTSPDIVFDQSIGDLFGVRSAGNLVDLTITANARLSADKIRNEVKLGEFMKKRTHAAEECRAVPHSQT